MDLFDLIARSLTGATDVRYPRPWVEKAQRRTKPSVSQDAVIAALRMAGHTREVPTS